MLEELSKFGVCCCDSTPLPILEPFRCILGCIGIPVLEPETEIRVDSEALVLWVSYLPFLRPVVSPPTLAVLLKVMPLGILCVTMLPSVLLALALDPVVSRTFLPRGVILIFSLEMFLEEIEWKLVFLGCIIAALFLPRPSLWSN